MKSCLKFLTHTNSNYSVCNNSHRPISERVLISRPVKKKFKSGRGGAAYAYKMEGF